MFQSQYFGASFKGYIPIRPNKVNQDTFCCEKAEIKLNDTSTECLLLSVFDGHGKNGANASKFVEEQIKNNFLSNTDEFLNKSSIERIIEDSHINLINKVNCKLSGTTACICVASQRKIVCANVGDSRAVLFSYGTDGKWDSTSLSKDHKLDREDESTRIERSDGRIMQYLNIDGIPFGPRRIWKKCENTPGLAMSRSLGDTIAHSIGVISTPEIIEHKLNKCRNYFLVVASDGLWEQLNNIDVMRIIKENSYKKPEDICSILYQAAKDKWVECDKIIDDITIIIASIIKL